MKKHWYNYLWIWSAFYLLMGFVNILFAWVGLLCFFIPLFIASVWGSKSYCRQYCGRGQLFYLLGKQLGFSRNRIMPAWLHSRWFRYSFLTFFMFMFLNMLHVTYLVFAGARDLQQVVTLLWSLHLPWEWAYTIPVSDWAAQFAFGFYSVMLTSTLVGLIVMLLYRPRSWCAFCPMGTMTQTICQLKAKARAAA
ncbi:MAG: 4Fe-4S binding protein [Acidaminococcaceae bacterium]|jgi:hypothetical protein|nr:4Fe-4S binding protein [Acidaminococcaceae bacterium]